MKRSRLFSLCVPVVTFTVSLLLILTGAQLSSHVYAANTGVPVDSSSHAVSAQGETETYIVQRGDTLYSIARRFNTSVADLVRLNDITNPNFIYVGQRLLVPASVSPTPTPTAAPPPTPTSIWTAPSSNIELFSPVSGAVYHSPIEVIGFSTTFEGNVNIRLLNADGEEIARRNATGGALGEFDFFHTYVRFTTNEQISGTLEAFETSAKDGSRLHEVQIPVILLPGQRVVDLNRPTTGDDVCNPILVAGYSNTFEANVVTELQQRDGTGIAQEFALGGNFGIYADYFASLSHVVSAPQPLLVTAYESDGIGIGNIDMTRIPVTLHPAGSGPCP